MATSNAAPRPTKPLLLLDIDGVLCPPGRADDPVLAEIVVNEIPRLVSLSARERLPELMAHFKLVWASSWGSSANEELAELLGLPPLAFIDFTTDAPLGTSYKLHDIQQYVGDRPCAYVDDDLGHDVDRWRASARSRPCCCVPIPDADSRTSTSPNCSTSPGRKAAADSFVSSPPARALLDPLGVRQAARGRRMIRQPARLSDRDGIERLLRPGHDSSCLPSPTSTTNPLKHPFADVAPLEQRFLPREDNNARR